MRSLLRVVLVLACVAGGVSAAEPATELSVDLSDVGKRLIHTSVVIPAKPGPLTLHYPKWIPGTHGPVGPISEQAGLKTTAGGKAVAWKRDDVDPFAIHLTVPDGASAVTVTFDLVLQPSGTGGWLGSTLTAASPKLAVLNWNEVLMYPKGATALDQPVRATLKLPTGWKYGTSLTTDEKATSENVQFTEVRLEELIDSPVLTGEHLKEVPIGPSNGTKHRVVVACDSEAGLKVPAELQAAWDRLPVEAEKLFGARHYRAYTFLLTLSDQTGFFGLEHHEGSDNRLPERALLTKNVWKGSGSLLPHEFVHSWNGKHRRPAEMIVPDYQAAQKTRLLWVYEGLTNYLGWVLAARSGLWTPEEARDDLALAADRMATSRGRTWRPLDDTAAANFVIGGAPGGWTSYRRSLDYYDEGTLIWLEADVLIRTKTMGKKSLDDFCKAFHGGTGGKASVKGFTFDDVVTTLNGVVEHDWKAHLTRRVTVPNETAPLEGLTAGGWKLTYADKPSAFFEAHEEASKAMNLFPSIGISVADGKVADVVPDGVAAKAGVAPGMKIVAVNGRKYSADGLKEAVAATKTGGKLELMTETGEFYKTHAVDYKGGAKYPTLERGSEADVIGEIIKPLTPPKK